MPTSCQHEATSTQLEATLKPNGHMATRPHATWPTWSQHEPTWSQHAPALRKIPRPTGCLDICRYEAHTTEDAKVDRKLTRILNQTSSTCDTVKGSQTLKKFYLRFFNILENCDETSMELKHIDLETFSRSVWAHLGLLWTPLGAILGVLAPT